MARVARFDAERGFGTLLIEEISRASADQRAGRAGRVGPGHCYRLYSSSVFANVFEAFTSPEIRRAPVEGVVLRVDDADGKWLKRRCKIVRPDILSS